MHPHIRKVEVAVFSDCFDFFLLSIGNFERALASTSCAIPDVMLMVDQSSRSIIMLETRLLSRMKISVLTDISILGFYGYIGYIIDISVNIFIGISIYRKLNCGDQSIIVGSNQNFKYSHLNISLIYHDISQIFY